MNFKREPIEDYYLLNTQVENIFINEYMAGAPGDYVKVYIFALMYAGHSLPMDNFTISKQLSMDIEDVLKAWTFWEKMGVIKKYYPNEEDKLRYQVEFTNLKEKIYGTAKKKKGKNEDPSDNSPKILQALEDHQIKNMFQSVEKITGRAYHGNEPIEILSLMEDYGATAEVIIFAYTYATSNKRTNTHKYVFSIIKEWSNRGLRTKEQVEEYLQETDKKHFLYKRVLKSLGFMRNPTEAEKSIMDMWFDEWGVSIDKVLEACNKTTGIPNPNINYVNSIIKSKVFPKESSSGKDKPSAGGVGVNRTGQVYQYYEELRKENEAFAEVRRAEVYSKIPRIKELEEQSKELGMQISKVMLSGGPSAKNTLEQIKKQLDSINEEKAYLLTENNFKIDYMDIVYTCPLCSDTGIQDTGDRCICFDKTYSIMQKNLLK